ncbi:MAG: DNA-processing protein DprA [Alphaproteobacteria bacterium]|nr:DNA-processing protein DprA [Alphaproteobacteria bacterium]
MIRSLMERMKRRSLSLTEKRDWLRLIRSQNVGPVIFRQLIARYGDAPTALEALPELARKGGRKRRLTIAKASDVDRELERMAALGGHYVALCEPGYPALLAETPDGPPLIGIRGHLHLAERPTAALVGARSSSANGDSLARAIANGLGNRGWTTVSGLARGIDTAAHLGSLDSGTIAVVAGGPDVVYPEENRDLMAEIAERGCIVAESPPGTQPTAQHFPRRNRIIAGLSLGTVVVEARRRSGALITARMAGEYGREVMAIPGSPLDPRAAGPNHLIREGATLVQNADDVIEALEAQRRQPLKQQEELPFFDAPREATVDPDLVDRARSEILEKLGSTPVSVDELIRRCHFSQAVVATVLLEAELAGMIDRHPGNRVSLNMREA